MGTKCNQKRPLRRLHLAKAQCSPLNGLYCMEQEKIKIEDESGDRKYFTIVPNYVLNHSSLYDREVYIQMKRFAGEKGTCWTSQSTLATQCGISVNRLKTSLKYLIKHQWIKKLGTKPILTAGGAQEINEYQIIDLWKLNVNYYESSKGVSPEVPPLVKGVSRGDAKGYHQKPTNKNSNKEELDNDDKDVVALIPFNMANEFNKMFKSTKKMDRLLAFFWSEKQFIFENKKQLASRYKRDCKSAKAILESGYSAENIKTTVNYIKNKYKDIDWTLETVLKTIAEANK